MLECVGAGGLCLGQHRPFQNGWLYIGCLLIPFPRCYARQAVAYEKLTDGVPYIVWGHSAGDAIQRRGPSERPETQWPVLVGGSTTWALLGSC